MRKFIGVFLSFYLLLFFSCSPTPKPMSYEFSHQKKLEAAHHWELLAKDFTKQIVASIQQEPLTSPGIGHNVVDESEDTDVSLKFPYVYLQTIDRSSFGKAFRGHMINELTDLGYNISYSPEEALTVRWSVQKIYHKANRKASPVPGTYTSAAILGYGVYKMFDAGTAFGAALVTGLALDLLEGSNAQILRNEVPHTEIILTLSISNNGILLARQSGTYYVNQEDTWHYSSIADFEGQKEISLPTKSYQVVNHQ